MLVEKKVKKEMRGFCYKCGAPLKETDFAFRFTAPNVKTYICSNCGYYEIYFEE